MKDNISLYRFTSFESLIDICQRRALTFMSPSLWKDPYEGLIYSLVKTNEGYNLIANELSKHLPKENIEGVLGLLSFIDITYFAQCWTKKEESDALWRIYSHHNSAIRLEVKMEKFIQLQPETHLIIGEVSYFKNLSLADEVRNVIDGNMVLGHKALLSKRDAFNHEEEVRIIITDHENVNKFNRAPLVGKELEKLKTTLDKAVKDGFMPQGVADEFLREKGPLSKTSCLSIGNASEFIESVMLHPFAPSWLDETLAEYCKINNINYIGRSKLYSLEI